MSMSKNKVKGIYPVINDYQCMYNKCSEFLYHPIEIVESFAMRKFRFKELLKLKPAKHMRGEIILNYKYGI